MNRQTYLPLLCLWLISASALFSAPIQNLKFTDVVKDVKILNVATKAETTAKVGDVLVPPNVIKTGADSRAELVAEDQTVTRVGANTIFSVEANSRDVNIAKGSVLFHSPAGKGGGNIKSAGATASVLGTTLIVGANQAGGFKVMLLEGKGQVTGAGGGATRLNAGQMSFAMPGQAPSQPLNFELKGQVSGSKLVGGFSKPLASIAKIEAAVNVQQSKIASGEMASTGLMIGESPSVAFKVDAAVVQVTAETVQKAKDAVVRARVAQAKTEAANLERTRQVLDPRFRAAVSQTLTLTKASLSAPQKAQELPIPISLSPFNAALPKTTGNYTEEGFGAPVRIFGNREELSLDPKGILTLLVADKVVFNLTNSGDETPETFPLAPFYPGKNYSGVAAVNNINFTTSVDFIERQVENSGDPSGLTAVVENFILSAGNTITTGVGSSPNYGTVIKSSSAVNFDIFAGGVGFNNTGDRAGFLAPLTRSADAPPPEKLTLQNTMLWNDWYAAANEIAVPIESAEITQGSPIIKISDSEPTTTASLKVGMTVQSDVTPGATITKIIDDKRFEISQPASGSSTTAKITTHYFASTEKRDGSLSIHAPGMDLTDVTISAGRLSDATILLKSTGNLEMKTTLTPAQRDLLLDSSFEYSQAADGQKEGLNATLKSAARAADIRIPLPLGFAGPEAVAIQAFNVSLVSTAKPISISGVPIYANRISISAGAIVTGSAFKLSSSDLESYSKTLYVQAAALGDYSPQDLDNKLVAGTGIPPGAKVHSAVDDGSGRVKIVLDKSVSLAGTPSAGKLGDISGIFTAGQVTFMEQSDSNTNPVLLTGVDASAFDPNYGKKLYMPLGKYEKYDRNADGGWSDEEKAALRAALQMELVGMPVGGELVPNGTQIVGVDLVDSGVSQKIELLLNNETSTSNLSVGEVDGAVDGDDGKFVSGALAIGANSIGSKEGTVTISGIRPGGTNGDHVKSTDQVIDIQALGKIELTNNDFTVMTRGSFVSFNDYILLENNKFATDSVLQVEAAGDITFKGVSVDTSGSISGPITAQLTAQSKSKSVYVNMSRSEFEALKNSGQHHSVETTIETTRKQFKVTAVTFTADNGDVVIHDTNFRTGGVTGNHTEFKATAKDHVAIYNSAIDHSKVAIAANTVVLKDVKFHSDSTVALASQLGMVSGNPGLRTNVVLGNVNILSGVFHGQHEIKFDNGVNNHMTQDVFRTQWKNLGSVPEATANKISISAK